VSHHVIGGVCEGARVACCSGGCHIYIHTHTHTRTNECVRGCRKRESWWGSYHVLLLMGRLCKLFQLSFVDQMPTKTHRGPLRFCTPPLDPEKLVRSRSIRAGWSAHASARSGSRQALTHSLPWCALHSQFNACGVKIIASRCWLSATQSHRMHNNAA
jgi:hypothetical protein